MLTMFVMAREQNLKKHGERVSDHDIFKYAEQCPKFLNTLKIAKYTHT